MIPRSLVVMVKVEHRQEALAVTIAVCWLSQLPTHRPHPRPQSWPRRRRGDHGNGGVK